jgi:hypothetical protein
VEHPNHSLPSLSSLTFFPGFLPRPPQAKEGFYALLDSSAELAPEGAPAPTFRRARDLLELEPRWAAVDSAGEREELFKVGAAWCRRGAGTVPQGCRHGAAGAPARYRRGAV